MSRGRTTMMISLAIAFIPFFITSCQKAETKKNTKPRNTEVNLITDINRQLSGIWYRSLDQTISKSRTKEFSWGKASFDYWTALCIDLKENKGYLQFKDGGYELETPSTIKTNLISLVAYDPGSPFKFKMLFQLDRSGALDVTFEDGPGTLYDKELAGKYFRKVAP
jgi:hypothetical protein